jgi:hypothetical protein
VVSLRLLRRAVFREPERRKWAFEGHELLHRTRPAICNQSVPRGNVPHRIPPFPTLANAGTDAISDYWIKEFLASDFRTTSKAGTRRLADALQSATAETADVAIKARLIAAAQLAQGLDGQTTSITDFMTKFALPVAAQEVLRRQVHNPAMLSEQFAWTLRSSSVDCLCGPSNWTTAAS